MVKIRLRRVGARNNPKYRVVVADSRASRDGQFLEIVGYYDPIPEKEGLSLNQDRIKEWLKKGAQPTSGALKLFYKTGLMPKPEPPKVKPKTEAPATEAKTKKKEKAPEAAKPDAEPAPKEKK